MKDYSKSKLYTIRCRTDETLIYVGATIQSLCERKASHKKDSKDEKKRKRLLYSKINGDWTDWYFEPLCDFPCNNKEELSKKEGELIRQMGTLNGRIAGRTRKEHYQDNRQQILNKKKEVYKKTKLLR